MKTSASYMRSFFTIFRELNMTIITCNIDDMIDLPYTTHGCLSTTNTNANTSAGAVITSGYLSADYSLFSVQSRRCMTNRFRVNAQCFDDEREK